MNKHRPYGHVYLIQAGSYHKIGITMHPPKGRINSIAATQAHPLKVIRVWHCLDPIARERRLHKWLGAYAMLHEWFALPPQVVDILKEIDDIATFTDAIAYEGVYSNG